MKHLISIGDCSREAIDELLFHARMIAKAPHRMADVLRGRVVLTMFFEPSTRTRLSFESAALRLGAGTLGFAEPKVTSAAKGETLEDTVRMCMAYGDALVIRHPEAGAAARAAAVSRVPIINAGDGANEHPTQSLVDLYTMRELHGHLDGLRVGFVGDLRFGRTVHSLLAALALYRGVSVSLFAPPALALPDVYRERARAGGLAIDDAPSLDAMIRSVDVLYVTRVQRERFPAGEELDVGAYHVTAQTLAHAPAGLRVLHPLPRVDEIAIDVDATAHAAYFAQAANGVPVRQAVLLELLQ